MGRIIEGVSIFFFCLSIAEEMFLFFPDVIEHLGFGECRDSVLAMILELFDPLFQELDFSDAFHEFFIFILPQELNTSTIFCVEFLLFRRASFFWLIEIKEVIRNDEFSLSFSFLP